MSDVETIVHPCGYRERRGAMRMRGGGSIVFTGADSSWSHEGPLTPPDTEQLRQALAVAIIEDETDSALARFGEALDSGRARGHY